MSKEHSPAPWTVADGGFIEDADGRAIAQLWDKMEEDFPNCEINGPLLAAAPDLLASAEDALEGFYNLRPPLREIGCFNGTPRDNDCQCSIHKLRRAIAKARKQADSERAA